MMKLLLKSTEFSSIWYIKLSGCNKIVNNLLTITISFGGDSESESILKIKVPGKTLNITWGEKKNKIL